MYLRKNSVGDINNYAGGGCPKCAGDERRRIEVEERILAESFERMRKKREREERNNNGMKRKASRRGRFCGVYNLINLFSARM